MGYPWTVVRDLTTTSGLVVPGPEVGGALQGRCCGLRSTGKALREMGMDWLSPLRRRSPMLRRSDGSFHEIAVHVTSYLVGQSFLEAVSQLGNCAVFSFGSGDPLGIADVGAWGCLGRAS